MQKRERIIWIVAVLVFAVISVILLFTRSGWQIWFLSTFLPRQQKLELVKLILDIVAVLLGIVPMIAGGIRFFLPPPRAEEKQELLKPTSPEGILGDYVPEDWREINWLDRGIISDTFLRKHPCVVLVGVMKSGKSREAAELVRAALDKGTCLPKCTFDITDGVKHMTPDQVQTALSAKLDCDAPNLFYINDLPRQATSMQLEALTHCVKAIRKCNRGYFVATARRDHLALNPGLQKWLKDNGFETVVMNSLSPEQVEELARGQARQYGIELEAQAIEILKRKCDGTPNHIVMMFKYLKSKGSANLTQELANEMAARSQEDIWAEVRGDLIKTEPAVDSQLKALAMFFQTNVSPYADIVLALAKRIPLKNRRQPSRGALQKAVKLLSHYGTSVGEVFKFSDYTVETEVVAKKSLDDLTDFLQKYRRVWHNPFLRYLNRQAAHQQECLDDLAVYFYYQNNKEASMVLWKAALKASEGTSVLWSNLGALLKDVGRKVEAEQAYRNALEADPKYAVAWYNLGLLLKGDGRKAEAELAYRNALEADPKYAAAWSNLGVLLMDVGRKVEAEQAYRNALDVDPKAAKAWSNLGNLLGEVGRKAEAEQAYRNALESDPKYAAAWSNLGNLLGEVGRKAEAEQAYCHALEADPKCAGAWNNLGVLLSDVGRKTEAEQAYRNALEADPKDASAWSNLGVLLKSDGRKMEAEQAYRNALETDPKDAAVWHILGVLLSEVGRKAEAMQAYRNALEADQNDAAAWDSLSLLLRSANRYEEAVTALNEVIRLRPESAIDYAGLGALYRKLGRQEEAEAAFNKAQQYSQNEHIYDQACIATLCGQVERAFSLLRQALAEDPTSKDWVKEDPDWEDYRSHPEFLALVS